MENNKCIFFWGPASQTKLLLMLTFITLLIHSCDGQAIRTAMFEIPSEDQKQYMLKDCRNMIVDSIDCKCENLGKECQQTDVQNCTNCSCLKASSTKIFYIKKRYGAVCLSQNNLNNAAGFGKRIHIYTPKYKRCAIVINSQIKTMVCNSNDIRQVWFWTPGNLVMNAETSTCLQTSNANAAQDYIPLTLNQCDSSDLRQKWLCDKRLLWGVSFDSSNITHAVRYYRPGRTLLVRSEKKKAKQETKIWTVFPTTNQTVCSASHTEGSFYLSEENTDISQIDLVRACFDGICSKKLLTSISSNSLSNCTILWPDENSTQSNSEPFTVDSRNDAIYFKWVSNPYTRLSGKTLDLTIECLRNYSKFEEYLFRLRVKSIIFKKVQEHNEMIGMDDWENSNIPIVDLDKDCIGTLCLRKVTIASTLNTTTAVCDIQWKDSTLSRLDNTSVAIQNFTELLSLRKVEERFNLEWNLTDAPLLANLTFNLTILCYNDKNENTTKVELSSLEFQTRYGFIDVFTPDRSSATKTDLYLAVILPVVVVFLLVIALVLWFLCRRKRRKTIQESSSKNNLHNNLDHQYSNGGVQLDLKLNKNGFERRSEDNPVYEHCTAASHPAVTIARNKIYECTNGVPPRAVSDIYEKPLDCTRIHKNKFYASVDPSTILPKPSPDLAAKPRPNPRAAKMPPTPPRYKSPRALHPPEDEDEQDVYDQPSGFIPSLQREQRNQKTKDAIPLQELENERVHSTYEKPLPDSPPSSGIYDYATREELTTGSTRCEAEKPLESAINNGHGGSVNSNGSLTYDVPYYDVLEKV